MKFVKKELPACPVEAAVNLIGNKWKILIMREIHDGPRRFNDLKRTLAGISQKVLTDNLRAMEQDGLITRTAYPEVPPRVEYSLTELGMTMRPIMDELEKWGKYYKNLVAEL